MAEDRDIIMQEITAIVDEYHESEMGLPELLEKRRHLATYLYRLSQHVKDTYGTKALSYTMRKYATARQISAAIEDDQRGRVAKPRPMSMLEVQTEALDSVKEARKAEVAAEADWEQLRATIHAVNQVLNSMQQEISDLKTEKGNPSYTGNS